MTSFLGTFRSRIGFFALFHQSFVERVSKSENGDFWYSSDLALLEKKEEEASAAPDNDVFLIKLRLFILPI